MTSWRVMVMAASIGSRPCHLSVAPSSPRRSRRSRRPSAIRPDARSTCSPIGRPDGVTASEVAEQFDLHANVARHHLDKLAAGGYLEIDTERAAGGAGRPSKRYRTLADEVTLDVPVGQDDVLVQLLGRALAELGRTACRCSGRGGRRRVRPDHGGGDGRPGHPLVPRRAARRRRRAELPRVRRACREGGQLAAHRHRALSVRRRRGRAPGHLRGRPRHGQGHARARSTARRASTSCAARRAATSTASPSVETRPLTVAPRAVPGPRLHLADPTRGGRCAARLVRRRRRPTRAASTPRAWSSRVALEDGPRAGRRARRCAPARGRVHLGRDRVDRRCDASAPGCADPERHARRAVRGRALRGARLGRAGPCDRGRGRSRSAGSTPTSCMAAVATPDRAGAPAVGQPRGRHAPTRAARSSQRCRELRRAGARRCCAGRRAGRRSPSPSSAPT